MKLQRLTAAALLAAFGLTINERETAAQVFQPTAGAHVWTDDNNWGPSPPQPYPNLPGAVATISAPTDNLTVDIGQLVKLGSLTITKSQTAAFSTTITATAPNGLDFDGGGTIATTESFAAGGGLSLITAPVKTTGPLTITQGDDQILRLEGVISGSGAVTVNRTSTANNLVAFNGANTYEGATNVNGSAGTNFGILRLNNATAIPGGLGATGGTSHITLNNSAILGLGSTDLLRSIGPGADQISFSATPANSGFAAYDGTRIVNFGGLSAPITWTGAGFGTLTLGAESADGTLDFQNPLSFGNANRTIRVLEGSGAIDGRISAPLSSTGTSNSFTKNGSGTLSLAAANTYTGATIVAAGVLRLDHPQAIPANSNITLSGGANSNAVLNLGVADFAATVGTGPGQIQFSTGSGGFAASGGIRKVTLNGGATLVWGPGFNIAVGLLLGDEGADSTVEFTNVIDLGGGTRIIEARNGTADIDGRLTGAIIGTGNFTKAGGGTLELPIANSYSGTTRLQGGGVVVLRDANSIPGGVLLGGSAANIVVDSGIIGLGQSDFTTPLGTGAGQIQFLAGNSGFAAYGANRIVNIGGGSAPLTWATGGFVTGNLLLSAAGSDGTVDFQNPIDLNGTQRIIAARPGYAEIDAIVSGTISGTGSILQKNGDGTLSFTAANTYEGGTIIENGRLLASNTTGSAVGSGDVTVTNDGTLGGTGFIGTAGEASNILVNAAGRIAPGVTTGTLTVTGNVTWEAASFLDVGLAGATPGVLFDRLVIDGAASLEGTLQVSLLDGFTPTVGTPYEVLTATGGVAGTFAVAAPGPYSWQAVYAANSVSLVASLAADFDADGYVDGDDLAKWRLGFGTETGATSAQGDADLDGDVDGNDFLLWQRQVGLGTSPTPVAQVPEPSTAVGLCLAAVASALATLPKVRRLGRRRQLDLTAPHAQRSQSVLG